MKTNNTLDLQKFTKLPILQLVNGSELLPSILVTTPWGQVQVNLKEHNSPFVFGSITQTEKYASQIIQELRDLEEKTKNTLLERWLKDLEDKNNH